MSWRRADAPREGGSAGALTARSIGSRRTTRLRAISHGMRRMVCIGCAPFPVACKGRGATGGHRSSDHGACMTTSTMFPLPCSLVRPSRPPPEGCDTHAARSQKRDGDTYPSSLIVRGGIHEAGGAGRALSSGALRLPLPPTPAWTTGPPQAARPRGAPLGERRVLLLEARHGTQRPL